MAGEDRQRMAREAHHRMLEHLEAAERLQATGGPKYRHQMGLAKREQLTRDRYDDAGEFAVSAEEVKRAKEAANLAHDALRKMRLT